MNARDYVLNRNEGIDTLHCNPGERCNTDDAKDRESIDESRALRLKAGGLARLCTHCSGHWPQEEPS